MEKRVRTYKVETRSSSKLIPGKYRGISLLSTVGETFWKNLNDRMGTMMEKDEK